MIVPDNLPSSEESEMCKNVTKMHDKGEDKMMSDELGTVRQ